MDRPISALLDLLFLLALLLPAPLIREGGRRWGGYVGWRTLMQLARLVPASPSAIRCPSIFVSALHAWRRRPAGGKGSAAASNSP